jgi:hypothetical protein
MLGFVLGALQVLDSPFSRLTDLMLEIVVSQRLPIPKVRTANSARWAQLQRMHQLLPFAVWWPGQILAAVRLDWTAPVGLAALTAPGSVPWCTQRCHSQARSCQRAGAYSAYSAFNLVLHSPLCAACLSQMMLKLALRLMRNSVKRKAGCDINTVSPLNVVPRSAIPAMFGHGEEDSFINIQHSGAPAQEAGLQRALEACQHSAC